MRANLVKTGKGCGVAMLAGFGMLSAWLLFLWAKSAPVAFQRERAKAFTVSAWQRVVPSRNIPQKVMASRSNNNLDLVRYQGKFYFAFRTAPSHFASHKAKLYLLSSPDAKQWSYEASFSMGSDLREPRFLIFQEKLFLYFFQGGSNPLSFAPQSIYVTQFQGSSHWSKPQPIYKPGYVIWRARSHGDKAYMSAYYGVGLYSSSEQKGDLQLLETTDGIHYKKVDNRTVDNEVSAEEGEFAFDAEGNLVATIRLEKRGGKVCKAKRAALTEWHCRYTPYKYDSALLFQHQQNFYVIARRNVDGTFNKQSHLLPRSLRPLYYLLRYSLTRKRTSLYFFNRSQLTLEPLLDFPSRGDTAYAGIAPLSQGKYLVMNYSSSLQGWDIPWLAGQLIGSQIYAATITAH